MRTAALALLLSLPAPAQELPKAGTGQQRLGSLHLLLDTAWTQAKNMLGVKGTVIMGAAGMAPAAPPHIGLPETWRVFFRNGDRDLVLLYKDGLLENQDLDTNRLLHYRDGCAPLEVVFMDTPEVEKILERLRFHRDANSRWTLMVGNAATPNCGAYLRSAHAWPLDTLPRRHAGRTLWAANNDDEIVFIDALKGKVLYRTKAPKLMSGD